MSAAYLCAGHSSHTDISSRSPARPAAHRVHAVLELEALKSPAWHRAHALRPSLAVNRPALQLAHTLRPSLAVYRPAPQSAQASSSDVSPLPLLEFARRPALHKEQSASAASPVEALHFPCVHVEQRFFVAFHADPASQSPAPSAHTVAASSPAAGQQQRRALLLSDASHVVEGALESEK